MVRAVTNREQALRKVDAAVAKRDDLHARARDLQRRGSDQLRDALTDAHAAGISTRDLGRHLGISHVMVRKLMRRGTNPD